MVVVSLVLEVGIMRTGLVAILIGLLCTGVARADETGIQALLDQAVAAGRHEVTIPPGVYRTAPPKPVGPHVKLYGIRDLTIHAEGVTLLCTTLNTALWLEKCTNVRVSGLTIDYDPLPQTQGTIVGLAPDHSWSDVRIHDGYAAPNLRPPGQAGHLWISDAQTRMIRPGVYNRGYKTLEDRGGGVWRLNHGTPIPDTAAVGDYIRLVQDWQSAHGILLHLNDHVVLENVTILSAPGFGIVDRRSTAAEFRGIRIIPGPPPPGAVEPRLFSSWADGINLAGARVGPRVEDCRVEGSGDDAIAVYYEPNLVIRQEPGNEVVVGVTQYSPEYLVGDTVRFFGYRDGTILDRTVTGVADAGLSHEEVQATRAPGLANVETRAGKRLTLDAPVALNPGDIATNWSCRGAGFRIADNQISNGGSRGIVVDMSGGVVLGNRIRHTVLCGIHLFNHARSEGGACFQEDVTIEGNQVADSCVTHPWRDGWLGAISVVNWDPDWPSADGHRRLRILNNDLRGCYGINLQLHCASDIEVRGNTFRDTHRVPPGPSGPRHMDNAAVVFLDQVAGVRLEGNRVVNLGPSGDRAKLVVQTPTVRDVTGSLAVADH